mmetsp:Transcript_7492/g.24880  ORF Transcript_7492/g.24880 Transcript_7492/m.24880 type:complete len:560 (+) Transcript_7492:72-1751(+)
MSSPQMGDDKKRRYDRQLRIWGEHGQAALESCRVCVLGGGPTATEALKNLVLGGIASYTVVDDRTVQASDLGNNFMVEAKDLGSSRARSVSGTLNELNETVHGAFVEESAATLIREKPSFFSGFDLVIATQLPESLAVALDEVCRELRVKLVVARSYGLVGFLRVSVAEHCVIESKPENTLDDLRLGNPWPQLAEFVEGFDMEAADEMTRKHIPFAVILAKHAAAWRAAHGGALPSTSAERAAFKQSLRDAQRGFDEENYKEALAAAHKVWAVPSLGADVRALLEDDEATALACGNTGAGVALASASASAASREREQFWALVAGLRAFVAGEGAGLLPLPGSLPDMTSTTDFYLALQRVFQQKAEEDAAAVEAHVNRALAAMGRPVGSVSLAAVRHFCKNAANLHMRRYRSLKEEYALAEGLGELLAAEVDAAAATDASLYLLLRACDRFEAMRGHFPGALDSSSTSDHHHLEDDTARLKGLLATLLSEYGAPGATISDDLVAEMCRFGAAELHCVASVVGGMAAQEAIKVVTAQFVPLNGALIYNAVASSSAVLFPSK